MASIQGITKYKTHDKLLSLNRSIKSHMEWEK